MRYFYSFLLYLSMPILLLRLLWRSRRDQDYRKRLGERLGFYGRTVGYQSADQSKHCIWVHVVSVGETIAATPFIHALLKLYPQQPLLITTTTPAGMRQVQNIFATEPRIHHVYLPYDLPDAMQRFLTRMQPRMAIIFETEIWPNLLAACFRGQIPICLLNARLSERSALGYARIATLTREMLNRFSLIAAVGEKDKARFIELGAAPSRIEVTGNIKFDLLPHIDVEAVNKLRQQLDSGNSGNTGNSRKRFIWIAASTHPGEEELIIAAHQQLLAVNDSCLLILVPRHPDRFETVARLCAGKLPTQRHSQNQQGSRQGMATRNVSIYLGDTMGELLTFYAVADVAFVGGSLVATGGHNMIEAAALQKPIVMGPHVFNFAHESELFLNANALHIVKDENELAQYIKTLMNDGEKRIKLGLKAQAVVEQNTGVLAKQLALVQRFLPSSIPNGTALSF